jgi:hypothetical protein
MKKDPPGIETIPSGQWGTGGADAATDADCAAPLAEAPLLAAPWGVEPPLAPTVFDDDPRNKK